MSRLLTFGLLASSMLVVAPVAAQERTANRAEWIRAQNQQQPSPQRQGRSERQRDWSGERRMQPQRQADRPQQSAPSAPRSAVTTTGVAPSSAPRPDWQDRRGAEQRARVERQREQPRSWNDVGRNNSEWRSGDRTRDNAQDNDRRAEWERRREQAARDGAPDRSRTDWRNRDDDRRWDGRRDNDWRRGDRAENREEWSRQRQDWSRQRDWNYERRLNERERWADQRRWDNRWRNDRRYDWQRYRVQYRTIYRMPAYHAPYGWDYGYRRFSIGIYLTNTLFARNYWISDPYYYRLPPVYGSLRWVRYYDDALLVDTRDGYVVDVIHDFFW